VAEGDDSGVLTCNSGNSNSYLSKATFAVTAGVTYYIVWDNQWNASGFTWQLSEIVSPCANTTTVTAGITTVNAIDQANIATSCSSASLAKWYKYTPTANYRVTITSDLPQNICKDTNFSVYTGSCPTLNCVTSDDNSGTLACNSGNTNSNLSVKTFDAMVGNSYYIVWDNKNSAAGFDFQLTEEEIIIPITYNTVNDPTINTTYRMCIVDMNNDDMDDVVGVSNGTLKIHYQGTGGTLTPALVPIVGTSLMPNWSMAAGDFNKDGFNDLMMGNGSGISLWMSNATGTAYTSITPGQYIFCQRTNFADLNNDGHLDAFSCHDVAPNVYYLNDGSNGLVHYQVGNTPGAMALGGITGNYASIFTDIDNDGDTDMFVSKCSGPACELHVNGGNNNFTN
ncbi:MAG TPA: VCBS repeat-containing protein, partial [Flavobacterium sp.]|nr:VCBS repeat-containing protein [Flavobacterium sp.]